MIDLILDPLFMFDDVFVFLSILMTYGPWFVGKFFLIDNIVFQCLWVSILTNPHETSLVHYEVLGV
jgi:hypothetical protein